MQQREKPERDEQTLKKLALDDYHDDVCKGLSLIEIFVSHQKRYAKLIASNRVAPELMSLMEKRKKEIMEASAISPELKKRIRYNKIIDDYFSMLKIKKNYLLIQKFYVSDQKRVAGMKTLLCPVHKTELTKLGVKVSSDNTDEKTQFPMYWCESCGRLYTTSSNFPTGKEVGFEGIKYINVNVQMGGEKRSLLPEEKKRSSRENNAKVQQEQTLKRETSPYNKRGDDLQGQDKAIGVKDFVVRRSVFKCRHNNHSLKNIDAKINIITENGEVFERTIAAGYCKNCNTFFIMESTYQNLKKFGTPICRISDEKAYLKGGTFINGIQLAQQSLLMQYGYTVSQDEGLSTTRRRKILSLLVDNNILTRSDIISYLDFFINTKSAQGKYDIAIGKWEDDRDFMEHYRTGSFAKYGVRGIHRLS